MSPLGLSVSGAAASRPPTYSQTHESPQLRQNWLLRQLSGLGRRGDSGGWAASVCVWRWQSRSLPPTSGGRRAHRRRDIRREENKLCWQPRDDPAEAGVWRPEQLRVSHHPRHQPPSILQAEEFSTQESQQLLLPQFNIESVFLVKVYMSHQMFTVNSRKTTHSPLCPLCLSSSTCGCWAVSRDSPSCPHSWQESYQKKTFCLTK